jgi:hypothetical protein
LDLKRRKTDRGEKLHDDELHSLYSSPSIVRVIKSRRMRCGDMWYGWAGEKCLRGFSWEVGREETTGKT